MVEIKRTRGITKKDVEKVEKALQDERFKLFGGGLIFKGVRRDNGCRKKKA